MDISVNGKVQQIEAGTTIAQLLENLALAPERVAVEHNRDIVTSEQFATTTLTAGDTLEIVQFVGGG
ncbi:MAG: thiamine biosynthesis protein ThiS [Desulfuromonas sp.]|nr:MAG: thiamine biosynthesis protein ThiS [Desulfuromonas sp.]